MISQMRPGSAPVIEFYRDGELQSVEIELGNLDEGVGLAQGGRSEFLEGVTVSPVTPELREQYELPGDLEGLVVTGIDPQSPYANEIPVGAVIVEINRRRFNDLATASQLLRPGRNVLLVHYRGGFRFMTLMIE